MKFSNVVVWAVLAACIVLMNTAAGFRPCDQTEKVIFLALEYRENETYMALDEISVMEGTAPDYRRGDSWYFQLIDKDQHVLEEAHFDFPPVVCTDYVDADRRWYGGCERQTEIPLTLIIPFHRGATDLTIYDGDGLVRFGPYDISMMD
jgi:hypothetical protein